MNGCPSMQEINAENMARLAGMPAWEIAEEQADIINKMNPALVEMLRRQGREKSGGKGVDKDKSTQTSGTHRRPKCEHSGRSWKSWSERVEWIESCRFTLDGDILGLQSCRKSWSVERHRSRLPLLRFAGKARA